ncbi:MAG: biotin/lipoyl-binding carrier protein [Gammaproteobacteria bacterium]|nr:biotin/lipoyl-binding carrier protein [Gammaproteobacteria bacterium]
MAQDVLAALAGNIWKISVEVGDAVEEDDEIFVVEALKMEIPVYAPCDGTISEIKVKKGDAVEEDEVLAIID